MTILKENHFRFISIQIEDIKKCNLVRLILEWQIIKIRIFESFH